ncbi:P-loop containing nucleoside triphosphate hydrolase protein [Flagelloscypha sp. PMI_526]|nr:P-loop containing nucleoside triphosphate hydrolase protein [Flagelloscypha sp. PMI_526]
MKSVPSNDPLFAFIRRKVTGSQVLDAINHKKNAFTGEDHSEKYWEHVSKRKNLLAFAQLNQFMEIFNNNQVIILAGDCTSKTTQIPQFVCYSDLPHQNGKIVACTQPTSASAVSAATSVAKEMDVVLGEGVGYSILFDQNEKQDVTFLRYMTDNVLLQEATHDPSLSRYSTIILDGVEERKLATDIMMPLLKKILSEREDLKVIIMTDGRDPKRLQKFFALNRLIGKSEAMFPALFQIPRDTHAIEVFYTQHPEPDFFVAAVRTALMIHCGEEPVELACREITKGVEDLRKHNDSVGPFRCIPLHSDLSPSDQQKIFDLPPPPTRLDGPPGRNVIVALTIGESRTVLPLPESIVYVVDCGFSLSCVYNPRIRIESTLVSPISKEGAQRRAKYAGHRKPGKCFRLYTEKDFMKELDDKMHPEIVKVNLAQTDLVRLDYFDAPAPETLLRALELLNFLAALDDKGNLTPLGSLMSHFPIDPQLSKALIVSPQFKCSNEILTIAAMLSVSRSIWIYASEAQQLEVAQAKSELTDSEGDHFTLLNVYNQYQLNLHDKNWASNHFLSSSALEEAEGIRRQLQLVMEKHELPITSPPDTKALYANVRQVLVHGFFMQIAHREREGQYLSLTDQQVCFLHPDCGMTKKPEWILFNKFVLTSQPYFETVIEVRAEWLLDYAPNYFDLSTFNNGPVKSALQRIYNRRAGVKGKGGKKQRKKNKQ